MITLKKGIYTVCFLISAVSITAQADDNSAQDGVLIGLGAQSAPYYSGSDKQRTQPVPVIQARSGSVFFDSLKGLGYDLQSSNGFYFENTLGYGLGRSDRDSDWRDGSDKLKGMGNIKATVNTGISVGWVLSPWATVEASAVLPLSDSQGVSYRTSVTFIPVQSDENNVSLQTSALFGDSRYMNTWYGVSSKQSLNSGYKPYSAKSGFYGVDTNLTWSHQFTQHWGGAVTAGYTWLDKHASDSPIVFKNNQFTGAVAVTYSF